MKMLRGREQAASVLLLPSRDTYTEYVQYTGTATGGRRVDNEESAGSYTTGTDVVQMCTHA